MKSSAIARRAGTAIALAVAAAAGHAASAHEQDVGVQVEQLCDARTLAALGRVVQVANFREPALGQEADASAAVAASACRAAPAFHGRLVAAAYRTGRQDELALVIAVLDAGSGQVGASYKGTLDADPGLKIVSGSLWIDTAAYDIAPGVRAFGLDITSGQPRSCAGAGSGARRSLFVSQGRFIRPVLQDLPMSEWVLVQRGRSACTDGSAPELTITENFAVTLGLAGSSTRGYRDLVVTGAASRDDGRVDERPPFRAELKWDGHAYPLAAQQQAWTLWRQ